MRALRSTIAVLTVLVMLPSSTPSKTLAFQAGAP